MEDFLQITNYCHHRENGLKAQTFIPDSLRTQLHIEWNTINAVEDGVHRDNILTIEAFHQWQEDLVWDVSGTQSLIDDSKPIGLILLTDLVVTVHLSDWMDQHDALAIDDGDLEARPKSSRF